MEIFAQTINGAKYVVSSTLEQVDWNAELVRGDLGKAVQQLKRESGNGLFVGGVKLPLALTELGLIDEYEFVMHPRLAGHGPTLFAGLSKHVDLKPRPPDSAFLNSTQSPGFEPTAPRPRDSGARSRLPELVLQEKGNALGLPG
jgi:dihydrofolate reductase